MTCAVHSAPPNKIYNKIIWGSWDGIIDVVTRLGSGRSGVGIPAGARGFSFLHNV
jgi:hypothetical protein